MSKKTNKIMVLLCSLFVLLSMYLVLPSSHAYGTEYGTSTGTAISRASGVHYEEIYAGNKTVFYKFYSNIGANVTVDIAFNMSDFNLTLAVLASSTSAGIVDTSDIFGNDYQNCSIRVNLTGYYYINVSSNYTLNWNFTLNLTIVGGRVIFSPWIPGFEMVYMLFGIVITVGIILWFKNNKKKELLI